MPRRAGMGRGYSVTVQFNDEEYEALRLCVRSTGVSQAETIRRVIKAYTKGMYLTPPIVVLSKEEVERALNGATSGSG